MEEIDVFIINDDDEDDNDDDDDDDHHLFLKHLFLPRSARVKSLPRYETSPYIFLNTSHSGCKPNSSMSSFILSPSLTVPAPDDDVIPCWKQLGGKMLFGNDPESVRNYPVKLNYGHLINCTCKPIFNNESTTVASEIQVEPLM